MNFKLGACQKKTSKIGRRSNSVCAANMGFQEVMNIIFSFMVSTTNGFVQNRGRASFNLATNKNQNYHTLRVLGCAKAHPFGERYEYK